MNLARIKCLSQLVCAMCKVQTVNFSKLASAFDNRTPKDSSMRRIQRFMAQTVLNLDIVAKVVMKLLPEKGPYVLSMDRTNWKFGEENINALVIGITYKKVAFPILFKLLDKRGNSNCEERIEIMQRFIRLFGRESIACLVADREFIGEEWVKWLNDWGIEYHLRVKENFWVEDPRTGEEKRVKSMFIHLKDKQELVLHRIYRIKGQLCYLSGARLKIKHTRGNLAVSKLSNEEVITVHTTILKCGIIYISFSVKDSLVIDKVYNIISGDNTLTYHICKDTVVKI